VADECIHLHVHDDTSLLDGIGTNRQGAERAAELGQYALAKTNHGVVSGVPEHIYWCQELGITPIVGVEAYFRRSRITTARIDQLRKAGQDVSSYWEYFHMVLLAKNVNGWRSIKRLTSEAWRSGGYRYPCIDEELLDKTHDGLICSTSCISGYLPRMILREDDAEFERHADDLDRWFGDDWYFAIQPHDFDDQRLVNPILINKARERGKRVVTEQDAHYPYADWHDTQDVAVMARTHQTMKKRAVKAEEGGDNFELHAKTLYICSADDVRMLYAQNHPHVPTDVVEESIAATRDVAGSITPFLLDRSPKLPRYYKIARDADDGKPDQDERESTRMLRRLVMDGLRELGHGDDSVYIEQAERELKLFDQKRFADFFLITWDFCRWARSTDPLPPLVIDGTQIDGTDDPFFRYTRNGGGRDHPIHFSARGSAGGAVCSYALGIVSINPIGWKLKFERFLNPNRQGLPDIDLDFAYDDALLVKEYLKRRYGVDKVYDMLAYGTNSAKAVIGRVARVFDVPHQEYQAVTKKLPDKDDGVPLSELRQQIKELDRFFDEHPEIYTHGSRLQGQRATLSEHASGIVMADVPLEEKMPVMKKSLNDDFMVTAWDDSSAFPIVSNYGYLKLDLLVVIEMAKHAYALELIRQHEGEDLRLDKLACHEHPLNVDDDVMQTIRRGLLTGIFQLGGSASIMSLTKKVAPEDLIHVSAINAVHRPATMNTGIHTEYFERRHDPSKVSYWHPSVEPILQSTYGLMIFQEQTMEILEELGGFTGAEADDVRRVMSKYYRAKGDVAEKMLGKHRDRFIEHASSIIGVKAAEEIWNYVGGFADYSFNLSHAGLYAIAAYEGALIKTRFPRAFYASLLTFPPSKIRKPEHRNAFYERVIREARLFGVNVLPPDVNDSQLSFTITPEGLRFGLGSVNGLGPVSIDDLISGRPFAAMQELVEWTSRKGAKCNAGGRKALAGAGALDRFGARDHMTPDERADSEEKRIGIALSMPDKIGPLREFFERKVHTQAEVEESIHGASVVVGGEIIGGKEITTRAGNLMAKLELAFGADTYSLSVPPWRWAKPQLRDNETKRVLIPSVKQLVDADEPVLVRGTVDRAYDSISVDELVLAKDIANEEAG
jgi:DNA polymerase-3 subunit alpha